MVQGLMRRRKEEDQKAAYFTLWQLRPHLAEGSNVTVEDILSPLYPEYQEAKERRSAEDMQNLKDAFGL
ncbi:hypothetical protein HMPREF1250_0259 [Megasphaera vaginalis (ex Srinivasan et al. 2021)]|uniref:Uncharacterized protein n=2 Tax=Megasphaera vaginalis (ex Srinivasan et al. 2021) TaxID=1111454 RepID=U7USW2_9FIRM|nr:hypothetical protein HMPREF1250_0259 [Megasphaera vaginalis (ex Srinivasan et al. 2021)]